MKTILPLLLLCLLAAPPLRADEAPGWTLLLTEAEWSADDIIRVPFTLTGTLITVRARVDTTEGNFFFDTGASGLLLNSRYFQDQAEGPGHSSAGGVTGRVRVLGAIQVDTFGLDNLVAADIRAELLDLSHIENAKKVDLMGIIGFEVFQDYEVLFDYAAFRLVLIRINKKGVPLTPLPEWEYQLRESFPISVAGHVAVVNIRFPRTPALRFALDSGAEQNMIDNRAGDRFLKENFEIGKRIKLRGAGKKSIEVLSGKLLNVRLDSLSFRPMATLLANLNEINKTYETEVDGILGYEFLSQYPVSVNYKKRRLTFYRSVRP
ncbi:MAG: aspartyl protease family protein [Saprospiraceae bacterium]|nr:aspartyl protease family protein [Saprospiraceae bacterium]MCC7506830.1 aspartyl protease family protein [Saprospiraceae bacterium]